MEHDCPRPAILQLNLVSVHKFLHLLFDFYQIGMQLLPLAIYAEASLQDQPITGLGVEELYLQRSVPHEGR